VACLRLLKFAPLTHRKLRILIICGTNLHVRLNFYSGFWIVKNGNLEIASPPLVRTMLPSLALSAFQKLQKVRKKENEFDYFYYIGKRDGEVANKGRGIQLRKRGGAERHQHRNTAGRDAQHRRSEWCGQDNTFKVHKSHFEAEKGRYYG